MPCLAFFRYSYFLYFIPHQRCLFRVEAVKCRPVHSIRDVIFPILSYRSARHNCCVCGNLILSIRLFSCWVVPVFLTWILLYHPKDIWLLTSYMWYAGYITSNPLSRVDFISFRPFFSRLAFFTWVPYASFHWMALTCHIEGSMITALWINLRMFQNSKLY
jgi:hypothetical protein